MPNENEKHEHGYGPGPDHGPGFGPGPDHGPGHGPGPDHGPGHGPGPDHGPGHGPGPGFDGGFPPRAYNSDIFTRCYLDSLLVEMRLIDSDLASVSMDFYGNELKTPIMLGVIGYGNDEKAKIKAEAEAAAETGTVMWVSNHVSDDDIKLCIEAGAKVVQIVKPFQDNDKLIAALKRAEELGCIAVGSDLDHAYGKDGDYDHFRDAGYLGPKSSAQLKEIVDSLNVPFIAKGILSVQDAVKCREAGVSGILLSHHHGIMDCAVPPLMILPDVRKAVGDDYTIIADCSIDTGADAFKAIALGADCVCTARAAMKVLPKGKEEMVRFINEMTGSLRHFMNRTSSPDLKHIDPTVIHHMPMF